MPRLALPPPLVRLLLLGAVLAGPLAASDSPAPPASSPDDPTNLIVAEGRAVYRQRDLDALVMIAARYHHGAFSPADEDQLRHALARILVAREPLLDSLEGLPPAVATGKAGDAFLLDLLDYRASSEHGAYLLPATASASASLPVATEPIPAHAPEASAAAGDAPVIVALPPLVVVRTLPGPVRRSLQLQIALRFADQATSQRIGAQAPIIRDAILGYLDGLSNAVFLEPKQQRLKQGITAAITLQVPGFPANAVLIPQLDSTPLSDDAVPARAPAAGAAPAAASASPGAGH